MLQVCATPQDHRLWLTFVAVVMVVSSSSTAGAEEPRALFLQRAESSCAVLTHHLHSWSCGING